MDVNNSCTQYSLANECIIRLRKNYCKKGQKKVYDKDIRVIQIQIFKFNFGMKWLVYIPVNTLGFMKACLVYFNLENYQHNSRVLYQITEWFIDLSPTFSNLIIEHY